MKYDEAMNCVHNPDFFKDETNRLVQAVKFMEDAKTLFQYLADGKQVGRCEGWILR